MSSSKMFMYRIMYASLHVSSSSYDMYPPPHMFMYRIMYASLHTIPTIHYASLHTIPTIHWHAYRKTRTSYLMTHPLCPVTAYLYAPLRLPLWQIRRIHVIWGGGCTSYEEEDTGHGYLYDP
jgi:hypothetical protein